MKISYNWLKQFIKIDWEAQKTGDLLTDLGLEVEGITSFTSVPGGLEGVVVGHVLTCEKHSNADKLKVTTVDVGDDTPLNIVCGAPNVAKGQKVAVAIIGTTLYDDEGVGFKIKKGKIRGEVSEGMLCAEDELGLGKSHDGILVLNEDAIIGQAVSRLFNIENDEVFEIGLTPNRADAMSHWGVARDLRAGLLQQDISLELITPSTSSFHVENRTHKISVEVEDTKLAPRYCGVTISGLVVAESPTWLKNRLKSIGLSPINNIVDATNYVLHELGQPLHAFDASKISTAEIHVKTLKAGTKFTTLDGVERELHEEDLMICNGDEPMCIAGVFGGIESGVTQTTTSIFLESAYFNPISVRKTAKRHGLNTDASYRFERGIDPNSVEYALRRAAILIIEIAGGEITSDIIDVYPKKVEDHQVFLSFENASRLIGEEIPREVIKAILTSLEIRINNVTETGLGMTIPAYRNDVTREVDVIEEILRVYGYNTVGFSQKVNASIVNTKAVEDYQIQNKVANQLTAFGFHEMLGNSLTSPANIETTPILKKDYTVTILNPLGQDLSVLRQSMLYSAMRAVSYNNNRKQTDLKLFEFGNTYHNFPGGKEEHKHLTLTIAGDKEPASWTLASEKSNFFYVKGIVSSILERLGISGYSEDESKDPIYSEGLTISKNKKTLVSFGVLTQKVLKHFDVANEVLFADFNWDTILSEIPNEDFTFKTISKFPSVTRDFALLLNNDASFKDLKQTAFQTEKKLLKNVSLFDVYTGKKLPKGKKSYALSFTLQDINKTLTDKQIDKVMQKLQKRFEADFGAELR